MTPKLSKNRSIAYVLVFSAIMAGSVALSDVINPPIVSESDGRCVVESCISQNPVEPDPENLAAHPCFEVGGYCYIPESTLNSLIFCKPPTTVPYPLCTFVISPIVFNSCIGVCALDPDISCEVYIIPKCESTSIGPPLLP